jgi:TIR domain
MANQEQLAILKQGVKVWNEWRTKNSDIPPDLSEANLSEAHLWNTVFGDVDLSTVKGLEMVEHHGPSIIGIDAIYRSHGKIPEKFLKGAGVDDTFITYIRSLVGKAIEYYSCFISYSSKDEALARRLYADLQSNNVRCWFAPEDLKWGDKIRTGIDEAIRLHDKLLLILSKSSVASGWVEREVKTVLTKERKEKRTVLFPVRVDKAVFESPFDWASEIRHERNIGDFTRWKDHDAYQKAFMRLLRDLRTQQRTSE